MRILGERGASVSCAGTSATAVFLVVAGLSACSIETGSSAVTTEQSITHDIKAVRGRDSTSLPPAERLEEQRQAWRGEPSAPVRSEVPFTPSSGPANVYGLPNPGNPRTGHDFALGACTPCHVVSPDQESPIRFANAPDFRVIANEPGTTAIGLNIWLTNPHPTMPKLVLYPQEAADVIAYILSLRGQS
jgi:hypothetical protein